MSGADLWPTCRSPTWTRQRRGGYPQGPSRVRDIQHGGMESSVLEARRTCIEADRRDKSHRDTSGVGARPVTDAPLLPTAVLRLESSSILSQLRSSPAVLIADCTKPWR